MTMSKNIKAYTMLRYFYLLCLLISIKQIFCYNHISGHLLNKNVGDYHKKSRQLSREEHYHKDDYPSNQKELFDDKDRIAQIDVVDFIHKPDYYGIDSKSFNQENEKRKLFSQYYDNIKSLNGNGYKRYKDPDYLSINEDNIVDLNRDSTPLSVENSVRGNANAMPELKDERINLEKDSIEHNYENKAAIKYPFHHSEKKCVLKHMKFPFFFHNKTDTLKPKEEKKRKIFCLNCHKSESDKNNIENITAGEQTKNVMYQLQKRSYQVKLCPVCKKVYTEDFTSYPRSKRNHVRNKLIHNSRQFYQHTRDRLKKEPKQKKHGKDNSEENKHTRKLNTKDRRHDMKKSKMTKRQAMKWETEKERQLKEISEIKKKVDLADVSPKINQRIQDR